MASSKASSKTSSKISSKTSSKASSKTSSKTSTCPKRITNKYYQKIINEDDISNQISINKFIDMPTKNPYSYHPIDIGGPTYMQLCKGYHRRLYGTDYKKHDVRKLWNPFEDWYHTDIEHHINNIVNLNSELPIMINIKDIIGQHRLNDFSNLACIAHNLNEFCNGMHLVLYLYVVIFGDFMYDVHMGIEHDNYIYIDSYLPKNDMEIILGNLKDITTKYFVKISRICEHHLGVFNAESFNARRLIPYWEHMLNFEDGGQKSIPTTNDPSGYASVNTYQRTTYASHFKLNAHSPLFNMLMTYI